MANLFKQSRSKQKGKTSLTERGASKKGNARANAQVAGLRFGKSKNAADTSESQKPNTVTIEDLDWMGNGVVRGNPMVFVEGALVGETCDIEVVSSKKKVINARATNIHSPSDERQAPFCPVFDVCGGCQLQHIKPDAALVQRDRALKVMMERHLAMKPHVWQAPLAGPRPQYRRKARLAIDARNPNQIKLGFREANSNNVINVETCPILVDPLSKLIGPLRDVLAGFESARHIGHISLIAGDNTSHLVIKHTKALEAELIDAVSELVNTSSSVGVYGIELKLENKQGQIRSVGRGTDMVMNTVNGCSISPSANDFIQINKVVNEKMVNQAIGWLNPKPNERIADWFSGLGNFTLPIAKLGAKVQAVEGVAEMVRRAKDNAQQQGIENVEWLHLDLADKINVEASLQQGFDKVLLDPSREGALTVCHALVKALPKTIVYVSCNPSTFSRDAKVLIDGGYEMEKAGVAEMFPFTHHMEMMALFTRKQQ
ncbi:MAG: 23S rRNA (uracil(1939)-C(5))-methyltransferase RlmD [Alteromonas macleodii]|uniref:23S rRNA (uracil(1939)-C(5))-methyltransferase RlmD n=1 Tax=Alteromonas TaxID=226 RepID=UPI001284405D|nr:23S rRNA (uracil(1939)-C(5))-methyltransferase RlmD [Alteromonas macleodii]MDM7962280.1 23S rRNA (uracil(1939)-C(5))-methyltransferase RlmD [Alteromonas macleodii]MDM8171024.1 23S rRNA (uracil(1939)-C(5))-methyltransferase RlmD [Alteromonas macleodii]CAI3935658.1 23S rRNA m(5)U-1939 methyltransferase [Alteromonas macleodii]VTP52745.1 23S rRNA m(5)U-1939 methyltransferase [Alteromonas macleodii]